MMEEKSGFRALWHNHRMPLIIIMVVTLVLGFMMRGFLSGPAAPATTGSETENQTASAKEEIWTCSMHPQIRQPKFGKCPLCFMDLVKVEADEGDTGSGAQLKLTPSAMKLAAIQTARVERRFMETEVRMVGKITHDETRLRHITARVPGRLDRLYVDYTGVTIRKHDHLIMLYSPQLIAAQQELLQSIKHYKAFGSGEAIVNAARQKLKLWGLSESQIEAIATKGKPSDHLTIYSPIHGVVVEKNAVEGMYVQTGTNIYTIADLSRVWVKLEAYETDLSRIHYGQKVTFETEAFPGETFDGRISFIDPVLDAATRTVKVRVNVINDKDKLKPEMFVRAVLRTKLTADGKVMADDLSGKWISPMHPEVIKDRPGKCDVCGMELVKAEKLGYINIKDVADEPPLVIPASAPLVTGERAVVYIALKDKEGVFEGRQVVLGPRAGDYYLVKEGLKEGEQVVVNGAFKIDSDLQIQAKPSMMSPDDGHGPGGHRHGDHDGAKTAAAPHIPKTHKDVDTGKVSAAFRHSTDGVAAAYFQVQTGLAEDNLENGVKGAKTLLTALEKVDMKSLKGTAHDEWMRQLKIMTDSAGAIAGAKEIEAARGHLEPLTEAVTDMISLFGSGNHPVFRYHCPMALDNKGAFWLQNHEETRNPYFGASMLMCKDSVEPLTPSKADSDKPERKQSPKTAPSTDDHPEDCPHHRVSDDGHTHEAKQPAKPKKAAKGTDIPAPFAQSIDAVGDAYFLIQTGLAEDQLSKGIDGANAMLKALSAVDMSLVGGEAHDKWMAQSAILKKAAVELTQSKDISAARTHLETLTQPTTQILQSFGTGSKPVYRYHCPMAFNDKGAYWLQNHEETRNPYFGAEMLICKDSVEPLKFSKKK